MNKSQIKIFNEITKKLTKYDNKTIFRVNEISLNDKGFYIGFNLKKDTTKLKHFYGIRCFNNTLIISNGNRTIKKIIYRTRGKFV